MIVNFTDEMNDYQVIPWQIYKERFSMTIKFVETILCFDGNTLAFFIFQSKNDIHCTKEIFTINVDTSHYCMLHASESHFSV